MDARREREERDRQEQRGEDDAADVIAPGDHHEREDCEADEEQGPDLLPCQRYPAEDEADDRVVAALERVAEPGPRVPPQVEGVDRKPGVRVRGLAQLADEARRRVSGRKKAKAALHIGAGGDRGPQPHLEREEHEGKGRDSRCQGRQDADPAALTVEVGIGGAPEEMALDADDGNDRNQEGELELHEECDDGADGRRLGPAAGEEVDRREQDQRADRVDLAPHRRVEDGAGVEEVDRRHGERGSVDADREAHPVDQLTAPAPDDHEEEPGDGDIGEDPRNLHQPAGDVDPDDRRKRRPDLAEQPEDVEIAGRIIGEVVGCVELGWSDAC